MGVEIPSILIVRMNDTVVICVWCVGKCLMSDQRVWNSSRFLIKLPEHTWGLLDEPDHVHWSNREFHRLRDGVTACD